MTDNSGDTADKPRVTEPETGETAGDVPRSYASGAAQFVARRNARRLALLLMAASALTMLGILGVLWWFIRGVL